MCAASPVLALSRVAEQLGTGWGTAMRAVLAHGTPLVADPARLAAVTALGVDETAFLRARPGRGTQFVTGIVTQPDGSGGPARLLDVVPERSAKAPRDWVPRNPRVGERITVAALDPFPGYARAPERQPP